MAERPILFNTEMVKAIVDGRKTQTRRIVKPIFREKEAGFQVVTNAHSGQFVRVEYYDEYENVSRYMEPPCASGDILWVRETWCDPAPDIPYSPILYKADFPMHWDAEETEHGDPVDLKEEDYKWRPSIHMPREYARIFLRVKDVRVERLQNITLDDVHNEGIDESFVRAVGGENYSGKIDFSMERFETLWDSTIKPADRDKYGWKANPWVWAIEFERCEEPEGWF